MPTLRTLARLVSHMRGSGPSIAPRRRDRRHSAVVALTVGFVGAVLLHLGLAAAAEFSLYLRDPVYSDKERKLGRIEAVLPPGSPVVLFIGTSRSGNGFDAGRAQSVLTDDLGRPVGAFNFGTPASGPVTHLLHLRRLLADGHRPALVLLEFHAPTYAALPDGPLEARFADGTVFSWEELDQLASYGCPVEKLRAERRGVVHAPWYALRFQLVGRLAPTSLPYYLRHDWSRGPDPNGWNAMLFDDLDDQQRSAGIKRAEREYRHLLKGMKLGDGPVRALRDALALCRDYKIPAVLVRMPEGTTYQRLYPPVVEKRIEQFLRDRVVEFGCRVANCRDWMPEAAFADGHHLLRGAATSFSDRFSREVIAPALRNGGGGAP